MQPLFKACEEINNDEQVNFEKAQIVILNLETQLQKNKQFETFNKLEEKNLKFLKTILIIKLGYFDLETSNCILKELLTDTSIGVASLGPGGPPPPDFLKITITQTSRSAVYNTGKSEIGKNYVHKTFHKTFIYFSQIFSNF